MDNTASSSLSRRMVFTAAFKYSIPVLLGYSTIGVAYGLLMSGTGYPWWLAMFASLWMYAGAGQFIAAGLFAAGTTVLEACLVQLVVNARHIAYGLSMHKSFSFTGPFKPYLIFSLTDETFALLSSLPESSSSKEEKRLFMFYISILDQCYWVSGSLAGALMVSLIPFEIKGIEFALTALFVVLMIEQVLKVKKAGVFIFSAAAALLSVFLLPARISILAAMALAFVLSGLLRRKENRREKNE